MISCHEYECRNYDPCYYQARRRGREFWYNYVTSGNTASGGIWRTLVVSNNTFYIDFYLVDCICWKRNFRESVALMAVRLSIFRTSVPLESRIDILYTNICKKWFAGKCIGEIYVNAGLLACLKLSWLPRHGSMNSSCVCSKIRRS